ncbi:MAG TPA: ROK family protein [Gammaproteobacteria bacterium]|jgi:glucokinase|nr:ROK family protein [Gammaproteobacteria bacterium]
MQARKILAADLGGTHARFLLTGDSERFTPDALLELPSADFKDMDSLVAEALKRLKLHDGAGVRAMLAVAGPVHGGRAKLTNLSWSIDAEALQRTFSFHSVGVLNDLAAAAWALSDGPPQGLRELRHGSDQGRQVVISVSTGVGTAYWSKAGDQVQVDAAESGHAGFAAMDEWALGFLKELQRKHGARISWERVLSGSGLAAMDAYLRHGEILAAAEVARRAKAEEAVATQAVRHFSQLLGAFAGDLVLAGPATGGVWLMGGVLAGLGSCFDGEAFLKGFDDKGRLSGQLAGVSVQLTSDDRLGLRGAWVLARHPA